MSATKELHEKLRNFVDNTDPLVALKPVSYTHLRAHET